jgi:hypothetical protein
MRCGAHCDTRSRNITRSRTGVAEAAERLNPGQKCEGATGSPGNRSVRSRPLAASTTDRDCQGCPAEGTGLFAVEAGQFLRSDND